MSHIKRTYSVFPFLIRDIYPCLPLSAFRLIKMILSISRAQAQIKVAVIVQKSARFRQLSDQESPAGMGGQGEGHTLLHVSDDLMAPAVHQDTWRRA